MLPVLNIAKHTITIPIIEKEYTIRPYLVGEEKGLLIAIESKNPDVMMKAVKNLITACVEEKIDIENLSSFELEYIFLQLRKISVNNIIEVGLSHKHNEQCKHITKTQFNLDDIKVKGSTDNKVILDEIQKIGVVLQPPTLKTTSKVYKTDVEKLFGLIQNCIKTIFDANNLYDVKDISEKELNDWVNTLNNSQLQKITDYISNLPQFYCDLTFTCEQCGETETVTLEGLSNFL